MARETARRRCDGTYLDTTGAYFRDDHYTGRPCGVSNANWRRAGMRSIHRLKKTHKPVVVHGAGLGSGRRYFEVRARADGVIAAADGVQIEHFGRAPGQDAAFLRILQRRGKKALAKRDAPAATCRRAFERGRISRRAFLRLR